ncbi:peptidase [Ferrimonas sediminicola]|uniref:Peptidase n=1 Tax=Ferrimonas sediminicola TaxID=2569538 RepID=A0A4U1BDM0_9GAMM|nr:M14 family metallocarboxypeptidase [Ferrimonas sediminicola]TKB48691.1 peptidase [Ferrimonas sediminicola]
MSPPPFYPIGLPGQPWNESHKAQWLAGITRKRSYQQEVVSKIAALEPKFDLLQYGALSYDPQRFPLLALRSCQWDDSKPVVLITGGVHGYETSGVHGALAFAEGEATRFEKAFNLLIAPCVSPWGYEVINRWNPKAVDPNRSFHPDSPAEESAALMSLVKSLRLKPLAHFDLHETTDSDEQEFRPALAAREGKAFEPGEIPDGFYLVGDSDNPQPAFQKAMIEAVRRVTHIAPADEQGNIIGTPLEQEGVINYPTKRLGLCTGLSDARYVTTTEVYPDSPRATPRQCNHAQVAAICAGLKHILAHGI